MSWRYGSRSESNLNPAVRCPGMSADALCYGFDPGDFPKIDSDAAAFGEAGSVELQPARVAPAREPAVGYDDICLGAGARYHIPVDAVSRECREQPPMR